MKIRFPFLNDEGADIPSRDIMYLTEILCRTNALQGTTCNVYHYRRVPSEDNPLMEQVIVNIMVERKNVAEDWVYTSHRAKDFSCTNQELKRDRSGITG
jgi:hypothetical protein